MEANKFSPSTTSIAQPEDDIHPYSHGIEPSKVDSIIAAKIAIESRINNGGEPVTLEEFKEIIIPWLRIHRTTEFILNRPKEKKAKEPREPKASRAPKAPKEPKPVKEKKMTKKDIEKLLNSCIMKMATGQTLTSEEQEFFNQQANVKII